MSKRAILDAAKTLLWEQGYEAMSPRKVMDASGSGQGSLYHHFRSKKELAKAALGEISAELHQSADDIFLSNDPPMKRLEKYLSLQRDGMKGCRMGRLANDVSILGEPELQIILESYFAHLIEQTAATLKDAKKVGQIDWPRKKIEAVAAALVAIVQGGFVLSRSLQDPGVMVAATAGMVSLVATGK